jgi:hypothetical protein
VLSRLRRKISRIQTTPGLGEEESSQLVSAARAWAQVQLAELAGSEGVDLKDLARALSEVSEMRWTE